MILNEIIPFENGFIYNNYCSGSGSGRQYFTDQNGKKIDAIRKQIGIWMEQKTVSKNIYYFLLTSLLEAADKITNTASLSLYILYMEHFSRI